VKKLIEVEVPAGNLFPDERGEMLVKIASEATIGPFRFRVLPEPDGKLREKLVVLLNDKRISIYDLPDAILSLVGQGRLAVRPIRKRPDMVVASDDTPSEW